MAESYPKGWKTLWQKGEIARNEQFLLFPQCFQKACYPGASKGVIVWEWVKTPKKSYLPSLIKSILSLVLQIFLYLEAFESSIVSDLPNHTV